jgi:hypothetical protein
MKRDKPDCFVRCGDGVLYKIPRVYKRIKIRGYEFVVHNQININRDFVKGLFKVTHISTGLSVGRDESSSIRSAIASARRKIYAYTEAEFDKIVERSYGFKL